VTKTIKYETNLHYTRLIPFRVSQFIVENPIAYHITGSFYLKATKK